MDMAMDAPVPKTLGEKLPLSDTAMDAPVPKTLREKRPLSDTDIDAPVPKTLGEKRIRVDFNPSKGGEVQEIKEMGAVFINKLAALRDRSKDPEFQRLVALALTETESANMWAVKAATWTSD
jgi:hypothetical protein